MSDNVDIRAWQLQDIPAIASIMATHTLWQHYGVTEASAEHRLTALFEKGEHGLVATRAGGVEGFVIYNAHTFGESGYIRLFGVDPHHTSAGTGSRLLSAVEQRLRQDGVGRLVLLCTEWNERARRFYRRQGFYEVGVLPDWVMEGTHEVLYAKMLS